MIDAMLWLGLLIGSLLGAVLCLLWRMRREHGLRIDNEVLRTRLLGEAEREAERSQSALRTREQLQGVFSELARDSLNSSSENFLRLASERFRNEQKDAAKTLEERQSAIESLLLPIREALTKTEQQIGSIERARIDSFATLKAQMELVASGQVSLTRETRNLVTALRRPEVRGRWGEITLRRLVEMAGMSPHADFSEQQHRVSDEGVVRPDMIIHMPERRDIVVDAKTPLDAYLSAIEAQSDEERGVHLKRHAQNVSARIRELASKQYWAQFERSPDFVVLFLPGDQFLSAALQENPALIDESMRQNVILATPTSLVALLKAVAYGWKQSQLAENAAEIRSLGEDLYGRLAVFGEHLSKVGRSLGSSVEAFNRAVGSLETKVLPAARRFPELGLRVGRELEPIEQIEKLARTPRITTLEDDLFDETNSDSP